MSQTGNYKPNYDPILLIYYYKHIHVKGMPEYRELSKDYIDEIKKSTDFAFYRFRFEANIIIESFYDWLIKILKLK